MSLKLPKNWEFTLKSEFGKMVRSVSMMTSDQAFSSARLHNSLEKPVKSGWLKKQQKSFVKNWQQKYFVLKGAYLCYYKDEDDSKQQGSIFLSRSTVSEVSCSPDDAGKFVFEVIPDQKKSTQDGYILMANTQAEMEEWVKAIKRASGFPSGAVFGQRLADTVAYEKNFGRHMVPILMEKCADFILQNGLNEEGVFRLPGQDTLVKQLKEAFDAGERPSFSRDTDVHTVSSLFKLYLRELPEPVFPWSQYEDCLACENTMSIDEEKGHEELMKQIKLLPRENYNLLSFICRFLYEVQKNSSINKMNVDNLAMVIGVNLLRPKTEEPVALMRGAPQIQKLMTVMISHHEKLFPKANDQPIETKTQRSELKKVQVPRSSVGWDAAEESISPTGDLSKSRMKYSGASPCSSVSDDNVSLNEDYSSGLVDDAESWNAIPRKRTQTMPITNCFTVKNKDDSTANTLKEEIFSGEFWASPNGRKVTLSAGTGHKRTLSELSQHRTSTYDNVPDSQCDCGRSGSGTLDTCTMKSGGQQSQSQLKNGAFESKDGDSCESLASSLEEMRISKMKLEDRIKSLEKENYDVWKRVVKLIEDLEKERNQRMAQEITLQNMKQSRDDAERRNKHLEKEIQGFVRAMSQAGKKPE
ncbi:rho GTPase-activating protein 25 isoform X1 [Ranitomeya variabilis]|uniref:rho GTPase-activating protein 25 isoform X1 n=1 Tax=Ranitomeya variabilis TaxID=490064 RepID=UPI004056C73C